DCASSIAGFVKNQGNQPLAPADVLLKQGATTIASTTTRQSPPAGRYTLTNVNCGAYSLTASYRSYAPQTVSIILAPLQSLIQDFTLTLDTDCESDCTFVSDNHVHSSCDGKNGCAFCDNKAKEVCDLSQPGWIRDYSATHEVECGEGCPRLKIKIPATVTCNKGTLVKLVKIMSYNGKAVKMVVVTCG
ncbi:MAG: carboxypeptidase-like regulatory domain-containing protein, partial [Nanoarchaeota archaeon]